MNITCVTDGVSWCPFANMRDEDLVGIPRCDPLPVLEITVVRKKSALDACVLVKSQPALLRMARRLGQENILQRLDKHAR